MRAQPLTTPIWAEEIRVEHTGEHLIVSGKNHKSLPVAGVAVESDLLEQSVPLARWGENRRKKPPHIEFANATTDSKLVEFCRKWGPFDGSAEVQFRAPDSTRGRKLVVRENLCELRVRQKFFSGMARLIAEIQSEKPNPERLFQYYAQLSVLADRKIFFGLARGLDRLSPTNAACQYAQIVVCGLLDQFPLRLHPTSERPVELPTLDICGRGVKDVLYGFLRLEYLRKNRRGLGVCPKCNEVFAKERQGTVFCCEICSKQHRSLEYYREQGRARRQEKAAASGSRSSPKAPSKRSRI